MTADKNLPTCPECGKTMQRLSAKVSKNRRGRVFWTPPHEPSYTIVRYWWCNVCREAFD